MEETKTSTAELAPHFVGGYGNTPFEVAQTTYDGTVGDEVPHQGANCTCHATPVAGPPSGEEGVTPHDHLSVPAA
jgi:hypothetical protein